MTTAFAKVLSTYEPLEASLLDISARDLFVM